MTRTNIANSIPGDRRRQLPRGRHSLLAAVLVGHLMAASAYGDDQIQTFFIPVDETHILTQAAAINLAAPAPPASETVHTVISVSATVDGTVLCYDHWEDGYELDISNPVQATTQIINLDAGDFTVLENDIPASPRDPAVILFDARDRIGTSNQIAITRGGWRLQEGTLLAGAVEVFPTVDWGTRFESPVGENLGEPTFEFVAASVSSGELGAVLQIDLDGDGVADEVRRLGPGANTLIEGVVVGTSFQSSDPVQVHLLSGDRGSNFGGRWFSLVPTEQWSDSYYNPVGTSVLGRETVVTLYNPLNTAITVTHETLVPTIATQSFETTTTGAISSATPCTTPLVRNFAVAATFDVTDVNLGFVADHAFRGDIQVTLQSPQGTRVTVMGAANDGNDNYDIQLDDSATGGINDGNADATGAPFYERDALPSSSMGSFVGEPAAGTWVMEVCDTFTGADDGTFLRARLQLGEVTAVTPTTGTVTVPAGNVTNFTMPLNSGGHFFTAGGEDFFALTSVDYNQTASDWGFTQLPEENLTTTLVVGWAPGRDPTSTTNPTENGSPIWVTATMATDLYVDFDGDPTTGPLVDPEGNRYDQLVAIGSLESIRLFDSDGDQSGALLYTLDGTLITAAWGQDPVTASAAEPALDLGTTVLPITKVRVLKEGVLIDDVDGDGGIDPGETVQYTITVSNVSDAVIPTVTVEDTDLDSNVDYVVNSTELDGLVVADDALGTTPFPLDEGGLDIGALSLGQVVTITFNVTVDDPLPVGVENLLNIVEVRAGTEVESDTEDIPVGDPELLITKVSDVVGDVQPGQIITYTVGLTNSGALPHRGIKILDALPSGVTYLAESTSASGFVPTTVSSSYDNTTTGTISAATPCATPLIRTFTVTDTFALTDVDLGFRASHAYRGDIQGVLQSPTGTRVTVVATSGGDSNDNYDILLADGSPSALNDGDLDDTAAPFFDRATNPSSPLAAFNGETPTGAWQLEVCDTFTGADDGTFLSAQLVVRGENQVATTKTNQSAAPLPLLDGIPNNLILAPDAFELQPAQVMSVTYQVQVEDPLDVNTTAIVNTAYATSLEQPFPVVATVVDPVSLGGSIGDRVWLDADGDGVQDLGEPGLANVVVQLIDPGLDGMPGGGDDTVLESATTDTNGGYLFDHLAPGNYYVAVDDATLPGGLTTSPGTTDPSAVIALAGEEEILTVDFGYTNADPTTGILGDFVWSDADGDGIQDPGEIGLGNVDVELVDGDGNVVQTTTTTADGGYLFTGISPGEYTVRIASGELLPGGTLDGFSATTGPQSEGGAISDPVTVAAGEVVLDVDFGFTNPAGTFSIADVFWLDIDADGIFDASEEALEGVTVDLLDNSGNIIATATSGADGSLRFDGVAPGDYTLSVADNGGVLVGLGGTTGPASARLLPVTVTSADVTGVNFGYNAVGTLGDRLWNDSNGDGIQDPGESGLAGVTVELLDRTGTVIATTVTDGSGGYSFEGLAPDQYTVRVDAATLPVGFSLTGDPDLAPDGQSTVTLDFGQSDLTLDFGYQNSALPDLSGTVFEDLDADGTEESGEPGFAGITLDLQRTYEVIDGVIDVNGDGFISALDTGLVDGVAIIDGQVDLNGDGVVNASDDGQFKGISLVDGLLDINGDGVVSGTDDGLAACDPIATTTTDALGNYSFPDLLDGDYRVQVTDTEGLLTDYRLTSGLDALPVTIAGTSVSDVDFGYIREAGTASIGDRLWLDSDRDGFENAGEPGLAGVTVELFDAGPDGVIGGGDDILVATTVTDATGGYAFPDLAPGNYFVDPDETTLPTGLGETTYPVGTNPSAVIPLSEGEDFNDADFGYLSAVGSALGDRVWADANGDGIEDPGEIGIGGVDITVSGPGGTFTVTTAADGSWLLAGLPPGQYIATVDTSTLPGGLNPTPTNADTTYTLEVSAGTDYYFLDWGFDGGNPGSIGDTVFLDVDGNGTQGAGEAGIEGVTVNLLDAMGNILATTSTDANGNYDFQGIPAGAYDVEVSDTAGVLTGLNLSSPAVTTITLTAGEDYDLADFGYAPSGGSGSIGSLVWLDTDGDGFHDATEDGLMGVTVDLWLDVDGNGVITPGIDNLIQTTSTDSNGEYEFNGLVAENYIVQVTDDNGILAGMNATSGTVGVDDNSQTSPYPLTLGPGDSNVTADFGYVSAINLSIGGTVFEDQDQGGDNDEPLEPLVRDATVTLYRIVGGQRFLVGTTTTDANGDYLFTGLPPGDYEIETDPSGTSVAGYLQTTQTTTGGVQSVMLVAANVTDQDFGFWNGGLISTPVTLAWLQADFDGSVRWQTSTEVGNVGFYLHELTAQGLERIHEELIPARSEESLLPTNYEYRADAALSGQLILEDVDLFGRSRFHGPFSVGKEHGQKAADLQFIDWQSVRHQQLEKRQSRLQASIENLGVRGRSGLVAELQVNEDGPYRVTFEDLLAAGVDLDGVSPGDLLLTQAGEPVPIRLTGVRNLFGAGSAIEFLGRKAISLYTETNIYQLSLEAEGGARIPAAQERSSAKPETWYLAQQHFERERFYNFASPVGDPWYDTRLLATSQPVSEEIDFDLPGWVPVAAPSFLRVDLWGVTDFPIAPDHHLQIEVNGVAVADLRFDGLQGQIVEAQLEPEILQPTGNRLTLHLPHDTGAAFDLIHLDSFTVSYPKNFLIQDGALTFTTTGESLRVEGIPSQEVVVFRQMGDRVETLENIKLHPNVVGFSALFPGHREEATYTVVTAEAWKSATIELPRPQVDLLADPTELVIISHGDFLNDIDRLAEARRLQGWTVQVVDVQDLYTQYTHGVVNPEAIHQYLQEAHRQLGARYALLVGGDTYDYLNHLGLDSVSFIPTFYAQTDDIVRFAPVDPLFGDIDLDGVPDLALGRLPVRTSAELNDAIDKILTYEQHALGRTAIFAADGFDGAAGFDFSRTSDWLRDRLSTSWVTETAHIDELGVEQARAKIIENIENGSALTSYFGHSGPSVWSFQGLFDTTHANALSNTGKPTVVTQWGCWNTYHVDPYYDTLGHRLLLNPNRGAAAVLGAATLTEAQSEGKLGILLFEELNIPGRPLGEAVLIAKQRLATTEPNLLDVLLGWTLLGDPTMTMP
ncbi:MAG: carboxypeptidase regulatory-like domain-containing protein [Deltaproteobacteria bacterium]|nr:carboxypeptidase regulatory-like domain-containing protein [Deltaproteobacteria bacterium]